MDKKILYLFKKFRTILQKYLEEQCCSTMLSKYYIHVLSEYCIISECLKNIIFQNILAIHLKVT